MDKLKPILAQKFWILSGICLILPLTGWWMSTAAMSSEFDTRKKAIDGAFQGIPQPGPNNNWTQKVLVLNKEEEHKVKQTGEMLWETEKNLMTWPAVMQEAIEKTTYRGEIDAKARQEYRYVYDQAIIDLLKIVDPYDHATGMGKVDASLELIPNEGLASSNQTPASALLWNLQEDFWLYETLLSAVKRVNDQGGATSIVDSQIKQILVMELRGGTPGGGPKGAPGGAPAGMPSMPGGPAGGPPGAPAGGPSMPPGMLGGAAPGGGLPGGAGSGEVTATFDPTEQFGPDTDASAAGAVPGGGAPASAPPGGAAPMPGGNPMAGGPAMPANLGGGPGNAPRKRYIEETPRYKTRGFYMEVIMEHESLPDLIGELSDSQWPLKVIRVQQVDRDLSDIGGSSVTASGMGTGGRMPAMAMSGKGGMGSPPRSMPTSPMGDAGGIRSRPPTISAPVGGGEIGAVGEEAINLQAVLSHPSLVHVAVSGIITLYLPPDAPPPAAGGTPPGAPGAPAAPATTTPTAPMTGATPAAPGTAPGAPATPPAATGVPAATAPATPAAPPATETKPAETPAPAAKPAENTKPAEEAKPAEAAKPGDAKPAPAETKPAPVAPADGKAPPPAAGPPAGTVPAAPAENKPATGNK